MAGMTILCILIYGTQKTSTISHFNFFNPEACPTQVNCNNKNVTEGVDWATRKGN